MLSTKKPLFTHSFTAFVLLRWRVRVTFVVTRLLSDSWRASATLFLLGKLQNGKNELQLLYHKTSY